MPIDKKKKIETNEDFINFILSFIQGEFGKILDIQKITNRRFKIFLEEGFYTIEHDLVYMTDFNRGRQVALYFEHGETVRWHRIPLYNKRLPEADVHIIFKTLLDLYIQKMTNALNSAEAYFSNIFSSFAKFDYVKKVNDDIYILKRDEDQYIFTRSSEYIAEKISHNISITNGTKELVSFTSNNNSINLIFDLLAIISKSSEIDSEEISEISKLIQSCGTND